MRVRLAALVRFLVLSSSLHLRVRIRGIRSLLLFNKGHSLVEVVLLEIALLVNDQEYSLAAGREKVVLERRGPEVGVDDVTGLFV